MRVLLAGATLGAVMGNPIRQRLQGALQPVQLEEEQAPSGSVCTAAKTTFTGNDIDTLLNSAWFSAVNTAAQASWEGMADYDSSITGTFTKIDLASLTQNNAANQLFTTPVDETFAISSSAILIPTFSSANRPKPTFRNLGSVNANGELDYPTYTDGDPCRTVTSLLTSGADLWNGQSTGTKTKIGQSPSGLEINDDFCAKFVFQNVGAAGKNLGSVPLNLDSNSDSACSSAAGRFLNNNAVAYQRFIAHQGTCYKQMAVGFDVCTSDGQPASDVSECCGAYLESGSCASCRSNGQASSAESECCSGILDNGSCASCRPNGSVAGDKAECCTGNWKKNTQTCQA